MKVCPTCGTEKELEEFHRDSRSKDGHTRDCKHCARARAIRCRAARVDYWREHDRIRRQTPARKAFEREKLRRLRHRYPEKWAARYEVDKAIRKGLLRRMPCQICGDVSEAHHPDYSKPLEVVWLCKKHHRELHASEKANQ